MPEHEHDWNPTPDNPARADLVLEGGGVRGIAHIGAMTALCDAGIIPYRIAGVSTGAIAGAGMATFLAAHDTGSVDPGYLRDLLDDCKDHLEHLRTAYMDAPYEEFLDEVELLAEPSEFVLDALVNLLSGQGVPADDAAALVACFSQNCQYKGEALAAFIAANLAEVCWYKLAIPANDPNLPCVAGSGPHAPGGAAPDQKVQYRLVVLASDVSRNRLLRIPQDYLDAPYQVDLRTRRVADDVYASAAVPYFFRPKSLDHVGGRSLLVDGGLNSGFPVDIFDRRDGKVPCFPVILIGLGEHEEPSVPPRPPTGKAFLEAVVATATEGRDSLLLTDESRRRRSILLPADFIDPHDFKFEGDGIPRDPSRPPKEVALTKLYKEGKQRAKDRLPEIQDQWNQP